MKEANYACFKLEEQATKSVKKKRNNFINVIGGKFAMSIRRGKLTSSFCKTGFQLVERNRFSEEKRPAPREKFF